MTTVGGPAFGCSLPLDSAPPANLIEVNARNGSTAALLTDVFGHATVEVTDLTTKTIFRTPEEKPLLP